MLDFMAERAPYRMSYHAGSQQVRLVVCVCVFGVSFQLFSCNNQCGTLAAQENNREIESGEADAKLQAMMSEGEEEWPSAGFL